MLHTQSSRRRTAAVYRSAGRNWISVISKSNSAQQRARKKTPAFPHLLDTRFLRHTYACTGVYAFLKWRRSQCTVGIAMDF